MRSFVFDTSVLIACIQNEPGGELLQDENLEGVLSCINYAETIGVLMRKGFTRNEARESVDAFDLRVVDCDRSLAEEAGALIVQTRTAGLSLGDRVCLALAARENLPVLTADRAWEGVQAGVTIQFIR